MYYTDLVYHFLGDQIYKMQAEIQSKLDQTKEQRDIAFNMLSTLIKETFQGNRSELIIVDCTIKV